MTTITSYMRNLNPSSAPDRMGIRRGPRFSLRKICLSLAGLYLLTGGSWELSAQTANRPLAGPTSPQRVFSENRSPANFPIAERDATPEEGPAPTVSPEGLPLVAPLGMNPEQMVSPQGFSTTLNLMILLTVLSLAPSILMMTTCFVRFVIVFGLLRQALGTQQLPPNQILIALSLFLTFMVMAPVWQQSYDEGIYPYTHPEPGNAITMEQAFTRSVRPLREFMSTQIEETQNSETVWMFIDYQRPEPDSPEASTYEEPADYDDVPLTILLPAYLLSELKTSFVIGFQLYLPFVIIDMVIASILISMGMMMLPPVLISLPFKLLLFVLIDGWTLTVGMLLESVRPFG